MKWVLWVLALVAVAGCGVIRDPAAPEEPTVQASVQGMSNEVHIIMVWDTLGDRR